MAGAKEPGFIGNVELTPQGVKLFSQEDDSKPIPLRTEECLSSFLIDSVQVQVEERQ